MPNLFWEMAPCALMVPACLSVPPMPLTPFHVAVSVRDLGEARRFYGEMLGCPEGRSSEHWVDFNLFGHQFVCHLNPRLGAQGSIGCHFNSVDGDAVPVPHYGVVLELAEWNALAMRLKEKGIVFLIAPHIRFAGSPGEQATMFLRDQSGNVLEFKAFADIGRQLFAV